MSYAAQNSLAFGVNDMDGWSTSSKGRTRNAFVRKDGILQRRPECKT